MRGGCLSLALLAGWLAAGCPKGPEGLAADSPGPLVPPPGGAVLLLDAGGPRPPAALAVLAGSVERRLEAFGVPGARVEALPPRGLRLTLEPADPALLERVEQLLTRPSALAIAQIDPGRDFFEGLSGLAGGLRVGLDRLGDLHHGKAARIWYLAADDRAALRSALAGLTPPAGRKLAAVWGERGGLAFLVVDPPAIENPVLTRLQLVEEGPERRPAVTAELARPFQAPFGELISKSLNRPLGFLVDGELVALPVVSARTRRGALRIEPSPLAEPAEVRRQAERLMLRLEAWQLVGSLRVLERRLGPAAGG